MSTDRTFFIPTEVRISQRDAEAIQRLIDAAVENPDSDIWTDPTVYPLTAYSDLRRRFENAHAAAEASDAVRFRLIADPRNDGGAWMVVDGEAVAWRDRDGETYPVTNAPRRVDRMPSAPTADPPPATRPPGFLARLWGSLTGQW